MEAYPKDSEDLLRRAESELVAVLFRAGGTVSAQKIADFFGLESPQISELIEALNKKLSALGLEIVPVAGGFRLTTHPRVYHTLRSFFTEIRESTLSHQALEVLAVIAYKQPITRMEIEQLRQVNSESAIRSLLAKRLIKVKARAKLPGRPFLYVTTDRFLETFGLSSLEDLPKMDFRELEERLSRALE